MTDAVIYRGIKQSDAFGVLVFAASIALAFLDARFGEWFVLGAWTLAGGLIVYGQVVTMRAGASGMEISDDPD